MAKAIEINNQIEDSLNKEQIETFKEISNDGDRIGSYIDSYNDSDEIPIDDELNAIVDDNQIVEDEKIVSERGQERIDLQEAMDINEKLPEFKNIHDAVEFAAGNNLVLRIDYHPLPRSKPLPKKKILKREKGLPKGSHIYRFVEPYFIYTPNTGNKLVLTYDRSVNGIRSYALDNIDNYFFTGKIFRERPRINRGKPMNYIEKMDNIADMLKSQGKTKEERIITASMEKIAMVKLSQATGCQGYVIRNSRCLGNCFRKKRGDDPKKPYHAVVMECLSEYNKYMDKPLEDDSWGKYASKEISNDFDEVARKYVQENFVDKNGKLLTLAQINDIINKKMKIAANNSTLLYNQELKKIAKIAKKIEDKKIKKEMFSCMKAIIKEAQGVQTKGPLSWWDRLRNWFKKQVGQTRYARNLVDQLGSFRDEFLETYKLANSLEDNKIVGTDHPNLQEYQQEMQEFPDLMERFFGLLNSDSYVNFFRQNKDIAQQLNEKYKQLGGENLFLIKDGNIVLNAEVYKAFNDLVYKVLPGVINKVQTVIQDIEKNVKKTKNETGQGMNPQGTGGEENNSQQQLQQQDSGDQKRQAKQLIEKIRLVRDSDDAIKILKEFNTLDQTIRQRIIKDLGSPNRQGSRSGQGSPEQEIVDI